jgi:hypothetical protein
LSVVFALGSLAIVEAPGLLHLARTPPGMLVTCAALAVLVRSSGRVRRSPASGFHLM